MSQPSPAMPAAASSARLFLMTLFAIMAFAANSLLCRLALSHASIDAASFTLIRLVSGALMLWLIVQIRSGGSGSAGSWPSAFALFAYAGAFSISYASVTAATGALLLFGAVQLTMLSYGLWKGERLRPGQQLGMALALGGLMALLLPGLSTPPLLGSVLMLIAGVAWGVYSIRGRGVADPLRATAGNFLKASLLAAGLSLAMASQASLSLAGVGFAVASGALASGVGYALWYQALRGLSVTRAAAVQLTVPVLAAAGGIVFLGEGVTLRLVITSAVVLGGAALVIVKRR